MEEPPSRPPQQQPQSNNRRQRNRPRNPRAPQPPAASQPSSNGEEIPRNSQVDTELSVGNGNHGQFERQQQQQQRHGRNHQSDGINRLTQQQQQHPRGNGRFQQNRIQNDSRQQHENHGLNSNGFRQRQQDDDASNNHNNNNNYRRNNNNNNYNNRNRDVRARAPQESMRLMNDSYQDQHYLRGPAPPPTNAEYSDAPLSSNPASSSNNRLGRRNNNNSYREYSNQQNIPRHQRSAQSTAREIPPRFQPNGNNRQAQNPPRTRGNQMMRSNLNSKQRFCDDYSQNDPADERPKTNEEEEDDGPPILYQPQRDGPAETQRDILDELLRKEEFECLVCCETVRQLDRTWNCSNCFNIFHLKCIKSWAESLQIKNNAAAASGTNGNSSNLATSSSTNQRGRNRRAGNQMSCDWRCPTCQAIQKRMPTAYFCYCSKRKDPEPSRYLVPHSCGDPCGRQLKLFNTQQPRPGQEVDGGMSEYFECPHKCTSPCHPGKCAPCQLKMERTCSCKKTKMYLNCVAKRSQLECQESCDRTLNCGRHQCGRRCHFGDCTPCAELYDVKCFCGQTTREQQICAANLELAFACDSICGKRLACGQHFCENPCHPGECGQCQLSPALIKTCSCGQTKITEIRGGRGVRRQRCTDPIPVCEKICSKPLNCGQEAAPHQCESKCHTGPCKPCTKSSIIKCECGANSQKLDCKDMTGWRFKCKRRCNKKLSCGRHKCLQDCCTIKDHLCEQTCGRKLDCGTHTCAEKCHNFCQSCPNVIWEEIYCNCSAEVRYPPQPCGTGRPPCNRVCSRAHPCAHRQAHNCHDEPNCPPCVELVTRRCIGDHEDVKNVYCYQTQPSCGKQCGRELTCTMHRCVRSCHSGDCAQCSQRCTITRELCGHPCGLPCHALTSKLCPKSQCIEPVKVSCECKFHEETVACYQVRDPKRFQALLEIMMKKYQFNSEMNYETIRGMVNEKLVNYLECDEACSKNKRTLELAAAFGITPKDVALEAKYSDFLKNEARANPEFIAQVHEKCATLIQDYKKKNVRQLSYNFAPMSRINRQIVHHYAESMGLKTESIDQEPYRSVMIKATKVSQAPARSLLEVLGIDIKKFAAQKAAKEFVATTAKTASEEQAQLGRLGAKKVVIDYFND